MKISILPRPNHVILAVALSGMAIPAMGAPLPGAPPQRRVREVPSAPAPVARPSVPAPVARPSAPRMPAVVPQRIAPPVVTQRPIQVPQRSASIPRPSIPSPGLTRPSVPQRSTIVPGATLPRTSSPSRPSFPNVITQGRTSPSVTSPQFRDLDRRSPGVRERPTFSPPPSATSPRIVGNSIRDVARAAAAPQYRPLDSSPTYGATGRFGGSYREPSATHSQQWRFHDTSRFSQIDHRSAYQCYPRSHYRVNYCNGYRGLGWYYGPPNVSYYYQYPGVSYYSSRSLIPSTYVSLIYSPYNSLDYQVQRALYELGYYNGPLDGDIGPMSRMAIANFQAESGLEPTGLIDETLLYYLGIQY